jgi:hypothetical protein
MTTIILQSEEVLVIEQEIGASVVETEVNHVIVVEESEINGVIETEVETLLVVESTEAAILIEVETETVIVVEDTEVIVLEAAEQGSPGPPGIAIHPIDKTFLRNPDGTLSRVNYSDGTYKTFQWTAGLLTSTVLYEATRTIQTTFNYDLTGLLLGSDEVLL